MAGRYLKVLAVLSLFALSLPFAGATWEITDTNFYPKFAQDRSKGVLTATAVDRHGDTLSPEHCDRDTDYINFLYDYTSGQIDIPLTHAERPVGWYFDDEVRINKSDTTFDVFVNGVCGVSGQDNVTIDLAEQGKAIDGALLVEFLTNVRDEYWEEEREQFYWNVSKPGDFGLQFVDGANLSYRIYTPNGSVVREGGQGNNNYPVVKHDDRYSTTVRMPKGAGRYILSVISVNHSKDVSPPYGGMAKSFWVKPTYLEGTGDIHVPADKCDGAVPPTCEKGTEIAVSFRESYADASYVNVTVDGSGSSRDPYREFNLEQWNETYWNGTVTIPSNFDTKTHGKTLEVTITGVHKFERDGTVETKEAETTKKINIDPFKVLGGVGVPFVRMGNRIEVTAVPVTPYTESPIPDERFAEFQVRITNKTGGQIYSRTYPSPFTGVYDEEKGAFIDNPRIPYNVSTGVHTAHVRLMDLFDEQKSRSFSFQVLEADASDRPVVLIAAGDRDTRNISKTYRAAGTKKENVLLRNIGDEEATVGMELSGDLYRLAEPIGDRVKTIPADQQSVFSANISLPGPGTYEGDIIFTVSTPSVDSYNITIPVSLTARCSHVFGAFCVKNMNITPDVTREGSYNMTLLIENMADGTGDFDVTAEGEITDLLHTANDRVRIPGGNTSTVNLPFSASVDDAEEDDYYNGTITLAGGESVVLPASINLVINKGRISVKPVKRDLGTFANGDSVSVELLINNTGTRRIESVSVDSDELSISDQVQVGLDPWNGTKEVFTGTATTSSEEERDDKTGVPITVDPNTGEMKTIEVSYTVYPDYSSQISSLKREVEQLKSDVENRSENEAEEIARDLQRISDNLETASQKWENGNFQRAKNLYQGAKEQKTDAESRINNLGSDGTGGGSDGGGDSGGGNPLAPFILPMAIILVLFAVAGVILYLSIVPEDQVQ